MSLRARTRKAVERIKGRMGAFASAVSATAAIEFAMVLPVMLIVYIGSATVGGGVTADRKLSNLSLTLANLTAQQLAGVPLQVSDVNAIFNSAAAILVPYDYTQAGMVVSSIVFDSNSTPNAYVVWSVASGPNATALTANCSANVSTTLVPNNIRTPNGSVILSQASFPYVPSVGYVISGTIHLSESDFMVPRNETSVAYTNSSGQTYSKCVAGVLSP